MASLRVLILGEYMKAFSEALSKVLDQQSVITKNQRNRMIKQNVSVVRIVNE
jgi:hypothetical protein